jgi:hypothetical protein
VIDLSVNVVCIMCLIFSSFWFQILLDAVSVFNSVTSTSLKKQSVKIAQDGVEVGLSFFGLDFLHSSMKMSANSVFFIGINTGFPRVLSKGRRVCHLIGLCMED